MRVQDHSSRLRRIVMTVVIAISGAGIGAVVAPSAAHAASCPTYYFCWYDYSNQGGDRGTQYYYTSNWITLPTLVNDSNSSWEKQTSDGACPFGRPYVYMKDSATNTTKNVGWAYNQQIDSFQSYHGWGMANKFDKLWNLCT